MNNKTKIYAILIEEVEVEPTATGYSAYAPDIAGCVATGATEEDVVANLQEAIEFHIEGLMLQGAEPPEAVTKVVAPTEQQPEFAPLSQELEVSVA